MDPKDNAEKKGGASAKENEAPVEEKKDSVKTAEDDGEGPEADIDSDEEAALREAGL